MSTDLRKPAPLTIDIYQALHPLGSGEIDKELENVREENSHDRSQEIGRAVLESLQYEGSIAQTSAQVRVYANRNDDGTVFRWVGGSTGRDQTAFLRALGEVLRPIENPRYCLARKRVGRAFCEDYFAVPDVLARKKEFAVFFAKRWGALRWSGPTCLCPHSRGP